MEPMPDVFHDGELCVVIFCKTDDSVIRSEIIPTAVKDVGRHVPCDWVFAHISKILS